MLYLRQLIPAILLYLPQNFTFLRKLEMVDLKGQYQKIKEEIDSKIIEVVESTAFIKGPEVKLFEEELATYLGVKHVIGCANGTDALQLAMMALGLQPGDEVITADFTYVATAEIIALLGLKPVLVDVDENYYSLNLEQVKKAITPRTKAIVPVHLFGQSAPMQELMQIAHEHNIYVVEDNAQAIGCDYTFNNGTKAKTGTIGHIGCTSFFPSKNLGCFGDGGALFTNDDEWANKIAQMANHGQGKRYYHDTIGVNSRLDSIQAAVLRIKLKHLDEYSAARNQAAQKYSELLSSVDWLQCPQIAPYSNHVFHQYTLECKNGKRDELIAYLNEKGIPANIYYPVPLHSQKAYAHYGFIHEEFNVTNRLCEEVFSIPMHTELDLEQQEFICKHIIEFNKR